MATILMTQLWRVKCEVGDYTVPPKSAPRDMDIYVCAQAIADAELAACEFLAQAMADNYHSVFADATSVELVSAPPVLYQPMLVWTHEESTGKAPEGA